MERAIKRTFTILAIFILLCGISLNLGHIAAFAADEDIPKEGVTYTLTYPDGAVVTEKDGKPLTFDDVTEALKEENWKLLGSGYTSDKDGKAVLPSSWTEGTIKIIETKVPAGYTQGTDPNQIVDIKDGTVKFVNPKIKDEKATYSITYKLNGGEFNGKTEDIVEKYPEGTVIDIHEAPVREGYEFDYWEGSKYYPGDKYTVVKDHTLVAQWKKNSDNNDSDNSDVIDDEDNNNDDTQNTDTTSDKDTSKSKKTSVKETKSSAATGDTTNLSLYFGFFIASLLVIAFALSYRFVFAANNNISINSRKAKGLIIAVIISMAAGIAMASVAYSAGGFTIDKVDDSGNPVEGAVFDVYGKPVVTFEAKEQEKVNISGTKTWDDADNQDRKRPDSITVRLHADGKEVDSKVVTAADDWKYTFTDKPKYEGDKEIVYSITEDAVADYQTKVSGFDITNSYTPGKTSVTVTKVWKDSDDQDGIRPDSVKVNLLADGEKKDEATLNEDSGWTYTFSDLDEKKAGETISYTVEEADVPESYTSVVTGGAEEGFTITNAHTPATSSVNINVELKYLVYSGGTWAGVVKTSPQVVTVSGGSMTESKTLSFTPRSDAQEVELPGAGTYTIAMTGISKDDLQPESVLSLLKDDYMPIIVDTVSAKVTVDENGNCTVDNTNTTCTSFALGYNSNSEEFVYNDIPAIKVAYEGTGADEKLNTLNPHSKEAGASASGSTVTLTTVVSQVWNDSTKPAVQ